MKLHELFEEGAVKERSVADVIDDGAVGYSRLSSRKLTSLKGSPESVKASFSVADNYLTSLEGAPRTVGDTFDCSFNNLTSLEGGPTSVGGLYNCGNNKYLTSVKGAPTRVNNFSLERCAVNSFEGMPTHIEGRLNMSYNKLTSLHDIHKHIKYIGERAFFDKNPIKSHVLGLLLIKGLDSVTLPSSKATDIINKYLGKGNKEPDIMACQDELLDAKLDEYAQL